jgi:hypothetical protein
VSLERLAHGEQRVRADIAVHDPERAERQGGRSLVAPRPDANRFGGLRIVHDSHWSVSSSA